MLTAAPRQQQAGPPAQRKRSGDVLGDRHDEKHRIGASKKIAGDHEQKSHPVAAGGNKGGGFAARPTWAARGEGKGGERFEGRELFEAKPAP